MIIRIAHVNDGESIAGIYAPIVEETAISFEEMAPAASEMSERIEKILQTHPWLVAEKHGRILGFAYASQHRSRAAYKWSCDVSAYVDDSARRTGTGTQLYQALLTTLIRLGYANAFAGLTLPNIASVRFHERIGFKPVGVYPRVGFKNGAWHDVGWWRRPLQMLDNTPVAPRPFFQHQDAFGLA